MWGQRDYRLYPPRYGDPVYRGRGRGRRDWLHERPIERLGRGFSRGNGIEVHQVQTGRSLQDRQEEEWSIPTNVGRRENDTERHESSRALLPPPPPTEDRLFTDWSSIDSPRERTLQHNISARNTEPNVNQTDNQTDQPRTELARIEAMGNTLSDVLTFPSACQQPSQVGTRLIDRETNMSDVDVRTQIEEIRIGNFSNEVIVSNDRDKQMPTSHSGLSSYDTEITGGPHIRTHTTDMIPQLDGPTSVCSRRKISENARTEQETISRLL